MSLVSSSGVATRKQFTTWGDSQGQDGDCGSLVTTRAPHLFQGESEDAPREKPGDVADDSRGLKKKGWSQEQRTHKLLWGKGNLGDVFRVAGS